MPAGKVPVMQPDHPPGLDTRALFDNARVMAALAPEPGQWVLDVGCGRGGWALLLAERVGERGRVLAFDRRAENLAAAAGRAAQCGLRNLLLWRGDAAALPLPDARLDACLLSMVLHHLVARGAQRAALEEISRVLRPGGLLWVMEFEKIEPPPGPPAAIRLAAATTRQMLETAGFEYRAGTAVEPHVYVQCFASLVPKCVPRPPRKAACSAARPG